MACRLESFVGRMRPLLLLERNAEVDKAKQEMQEATEEARCVRSLGCPHSIDTVFACAVEWQYTVQSEV